MGGLSVKRWLCLLAAAALVAAGALLLPERREPLSQAQRESRAREDAFRGNISVWHINAWRTGGTGASNLLAEVLTQLERQNPGAYFALEVITAEDAARRMAMGEHPDVLSAPGGMTLPCDRARQSLETADLWPCYREQLGESAQFIPWIASDTWVMVRQSALSARKLSPPGEDWTAQEMVELAGALTREDMAGIAAARFRWPQLEALGFAPEHIMDGSLTERQAWNHLVEANAAMLLAGPWEQMTLQWRLREDRGPDLVLLPWPRELPQLRTVQWISCLASGDEAKDRLCAQVAELLTGETMQQRVRSEARCLPCTGMPEGEEGRAVLYALPDRTVNVRGEWGPNCGWGPQEGVYFHAGGE